MIDVILKFWKMRIPQYNCCAGKVEYLPESMVLCLKFEEDEK
jgi:hypothetical protein